ncbi:ELWxxDGT repeat protein [Hymenobacter chitinivorans]|uniref:Putative secreted protein (Por secretion system target) n=1 Tax=Hymenobacter chitinivorans DSM 11115 TaxID=1121954 RepID=A0A2M9ARV2_9BACT|nr:ELWxxDGT repeat protein [Hymenobacter chitinivorans]PJJ48434.1 putative secreted protein (Por secretion system target) [Hymenobacter chitinivorans DSM 11115]
MKKTATLLLGLCTLLGQAASAQTLLKDIIPGANGGYPSSFAAASGGLLFAAQDPSLVFGDNQLWKTDGTSAGTTLLKAFKVNPNGEDRFVSMGGNVYFSAYEAATGWELWKSDGTAAGTVLVKDIWPGGGSAASSTPSNLVVMNNSLYFYAADGVSGRELWASDGTAGGTRLVKDIRPGSLPALTATHLDDIAVVGNTLYFNAQDGAGGNELWKSDGTAAGTVLVKDLRAGNNTGSNPHHLAACNGKVFFTADDGTVGEELFVSDGTVGGTGLIKDIAVGGNAYPSGMTALGNTLYFTAYTQTEGSELWRTDGSAAGTMLVKDLRSGTGSAFGIVGSSNPEMMPYKGSLYFAAFDGVDYRLYKTDGTAAGTVLMTPSTKYNEFDYIGAFSVVDDYLLFSAGSQYDQTVGVELWRSDGTVAGTTRFKDLNTGRGSSYPSRMVPYNGAWYFAAADDAHGAELWRYAGTSSSVAASQQQLATAWPNPVTDRLYLTKRLPQQAALTYEVRNAIGQVVAQGTMGAATSIGVSHLPAGVYFLHLQAAAGQQTVKFMKH